MIQQFEEADAYIIATPIFQASIPGVLKNAFDFLHLKQCAISLYPLLQMEAHTGIIL